MVRTGYVDEAFRSVPLFAKFTRRQLAEITKLTFSVTLPKGRQLTTQGAWGDEVMIILSGKATVCIDGDPIATLEKGDWVGEIAALSPGFRTATVTADTEMVVAAMNRREFESLLRLPSVPLTLLGDLAGRIRLADARISTLAV